MIYSDTFKGGFTQSEIGMLDECSFKWNMRYNHRFEPEGYYRLPLMFGSAWHKFKEILLKEKEVVIPTMEFPEGAVITEGDEEKLKTLQAMLNGMCMGYAKHFHDEIKRMKPKFVEEEIELDYEFNGEIIQLKGKIDLLTEKGILFDSKSTSMLRNDILAKWDFKFQFMFYCWLVVQKIGLKHIKEFVVDATKKPQIRPKQGEPLIAYGRRVEMELLGKPLEYFYRSSVEVTKETMQHFETNILTPKLERFRLMQENPDLKIWENKNTEACHHFNETCPYFPVCAEGADPKKVYIVLNQKHTEYNNTND